MSRTSPPARSARPQRPPERSRRSWMFELGASLAVILGIAGAARMAWVCDAMQKALPQLHARLHYPCDLIIHVNVLG
jgi:hypothetical protein